MVSVIGRVCYLQVRRGESTTKVAALRFPAGGYHITSREWRRATAKGDGIAHVGDGIRELPWQRSPDGGVSVGSVGSDRPLGRVE